MNCRTKSEIIMPSDFWPQSYLSWFRNDPISFTFISELVFVGTVAFRDCKTISWRKESTMSKWCPVLK